MYILKSVCLKMVFGDLKNLGVQTLPYEPQIVFNSYNSGIPKLDFMINTLNIYL